MLFMIVRRVTLPDRDALHRSHAKLCGAARCK